LRSKDDSTQEGESSKTRNVTFFVSSPGDPPCENAKMKDKITTLKTWRAFAWRPFAPPDEDTTNNRRKYDGWNDALFGVAGRKVAIRKHEKVIILRVFAWRLFEFLPRKHVYTTWHKSATIVFSLLTCINNISKSNKHNKCDV